MELARIAYGLAAAAAAWAPATASGQEAAPTAEAAAIVDRFLETLRSNSHAELGSFVTDRVRTGGGRSLRRDQVVLVHQGYTVVMFGPLRSSSCEAQGRRRMNCILRFQSRVLRQRYTVDSGRISGIETLPLPRGMLN